jgi:hypothetical protein
VITQTLNGIGSYHIEYVATAGRYSSQVKVTTPAGEVLNISIGQDIYVAHSEHVQFPALPRR